MKKLLLVLAILCPCISLAQKLSPAELARCKAQAQRVTIIRDNWGVPHIYGKTDADAVFGLMYAQCEENFKGIERNYLYQLGKQATVDGESSLYQDVQLQLIADSAEAIKEYQTSPVWFRKLMNAFADGINYYLHKHPQVRPKVLYHFKPWYALMFTDGSVAATITGGITLDETKQFYSGAEAMYGSIKTIKPVNTEDVDEHVFGREMGSNGFAISPKRSATGHAMLYINPHVPFYFRLEVQISSEEGLNAYGAVTWGQFFIYQGFNAHCGWMHTSSYADVADAYAEKVTQQNGKWYYEYDGKQLPVTERDLLIDRKNGDKIETVKIKGYYTHHGPVLGSRDGKWLALKANNRSYKALLESWLITKANTYTQYVKAMDLLSNATNNTVYADDKGNTVFWYGNFMPKRDPKMDWTLPVDGTTKATEWQGLHPLKEIVTVMNPAGGWIQNCNATPFTAAGKDTPDPSKYPAYMAPNGQNYRQINAQKLLETKDKLTIDDLTALGYDRYLTAFDALLPPLLSAYNNSTDTALLSRLRQPINLLTHWDRRSNVASIATTVAIEYGAAIFALLPKPATTEAGTYQTDRVNQLLKELKPKQLLDILDNTIATLNKRHGNWMVTWGNINRYQRPADGMSFDDSQPSIPAASVASVFGQLPSFVTRGGNGTKRRYGYSGNSFIAAVEFGPTVKAKSLITGGQSFKAGCPLFTDQAQMYLDGKFKDVLFYKEDVLKNVWQRYHPGQVKQQYTNKGDCLDD